LIDRPEGGERAILVHLHLREPHLTSDLQEFRELALSAGAEVIHVASSNRDVPDSKYFIGSGKVEELRELVATENIDLILFDHSLTPAQERNLERVVKCRVLDRTGLILDIFAQRARTYEGKLQVELAQLKHHATRLVRGWTHLERQKGGIGLRGPGETQLEVDRRLIRGRIKYITARLEKVRAQRQQSRRARQKAELATVSLVGYTNAGKSSLFNALTGANVLVENKLFATLDPTLRSLELPIIGKVIFADTVGFVSKLPHDLVEAFRATLEEVKDADLLLHVIDSQDEEWRKRMTEVDEVLQTIEALAVPRIEVYNKIDLSPQVKPHIERDGEGKIHRVFVSATQDIGLDLLRDAIVERLGTEITRGQIHLEPEQARIRALLFNIGAVVKETILEDGGSLLDIAIPTLKWRRLREEEPELEKSWKA
jgi:GTPase